MEVVPAVVEPTNILEGDGHSVEQTQVSFIPYADQLLLGPDRQATFETESLPHPSDQFEPPSVVATDDLVNPEENFVGDISAGSPVSGRRQQIGFAMRALPEWRERS